MIFKITSMSNVSKQYKIHPRVICCTSIQMYHLKCIKTLDAAVFWPPLLQSLCGLDGMPECMLEWTRFSAPWDDASGVCRGCIASVCSVLQIFPKKFLKFWYWSGIWRHLRSTFRLIKSFQLLGPKRRFSSFFEGQTSNLLDFQQ